MLTNLNSGRPNTLDLKKHSALARFLMPGIWRASIRVTGHAQSMFEIEDCNPEKKMEVEKTGFNA